ncbi:16772_t:CDS:2 [Funneliformis caledonium]|uniref:16772_t:CDS:1 n=1 Tax=Funneliformis caledonium TaxID=1117310 RepID=A0A9N9HEF9_9GLOM|nr:16772_t:CDS:2 [Funneliformis caledonium]
MQMISHSVAYNTISANVKKIEIQIKDETETFTSAKDLKRKGENNKSNEELVSLFDKSNEDTFLENINEKALKKEKKLPLAVMIDS